MKRFIRAVMALSAKPRLVICKTCYAVIDAAWLEKHFTWHDENGH